MVVKLTTAEADKACQKYFTVLSEIRESYV